MQLRSYYLFLMYSVLMPSCMAHSNPIPSTDTIKPETKANYIYPLPFSDFDSDPYFIETNYINSAYGPSSISRNIIQDKRGDFWFATWEGIVKYNASDPNNKEPFTNVTNRDALRRYHMFSVFEDRSGIIWFGSIGAGVYRYDPQAYETGKKAFTNYTTADGFVGDKLGCTFQDSHGKIWFGTMQGLSCYDPNKNDKGKVTFQNYTTADGMTSNDINSIVEDKDGRLWLATRGNLCIYDPVAAASGLPAFMEFKNQDGSPFVNVRTIIKDHQNNIWIGGNNGLWRISKAHRGNKSSDITFTQFSDHFTGYLYQDRESNVYFGSADPKKNLWTLYRLDSSLVNTAFAKAEKIVEEDGQIFGIVEDSKGNMWYGHERGVCRFDPSIVQMGKKGLECFNRKE